MRKSIRELLDLIDLRIAAEPESFGTTGARRRVAQLRSALGQVGELRVDLPKPAMSKQAKKALPRSRKARTALSSKGTKPADKPASTVRVTKPTSKEQEE